MGYFNEEVAVRTSHYLLSAFSLATAIGFNSFINTLIDKYYPFSREHVIAKLIYALILVILLIILVMYLPNTTRQLPANVRETLIANKLFPIK